MNCIKGKQHSYYIDHFADKKPFCISCGLLKSTIENEEMQRADDIIGHNVSGMESVRKPKGLK